MTRLLLVLLALGLALPAGALARPGTLDPRYGDRGTTLLGRTGASLTGRALALQGDSRAIAAGSDGRSFLVARLRGSGDRDRSFGRGGSRSVRVRGATRAEARDVALFRDGRILVAGTAIVRDVRRFAVARLLPDGNLDPNFGSGGVAVVGPPGADLEAMALQAEGELLLAGSVPDGAGRAALVMRLFADGTTDPGFGRRGTVDGGEAGLAGRARDVVVLPSGRIAFAVAPERGRAAAGTFVAARLTSTGAFDPSFDGDGVARVATTARAVRDGGAAALAPTRGGGLLLAGTARGPARRDDATAVRLTSAGRPDPSFGRGGVARVPAPRGRSLKVETMGRDGRGRIVLAGRARRLGAFALRLRASGGRDGSFGAGGLFGGPLRRGGFAALVVRRDATVFAAGSARARGRSHLLVARLRRR